MDLSLISFLSFLITFQLLFVGIFLITHKKGIRRNNTLLGTIFILIAWNMGDLTLQMNDVVLKWEFLQHIDDGFFLLYGPIFYLYAQGVIFRDFKLSSGKLLHLIPYLLLTISLLSLRNLTPRTSEEIIQNNLPWQFYLLSSLVYAHFFVYLGLTYKSLRNYRQIIKNKYSQIDQINLDTINKDLEKGKKTQAHTERLLLGLTRIALYTNSWLSAASFQETIRVLVEASTTKKLDALEGLKENVIIGKLIPAGEIYRKRNPDLVKEMAKHQPDEIAENIVTDHVPEEN